MSDAVRKVGSAGQPFLGRFGRFRLRRPLEDQAASGGSRGGLFRKYVMLIVGLVSLVLLVNSALDFWFGYEENKAALFRVQQEKAGAAARRIEQFVDEIERQLGWTTAPQWAASPLEQRRFDYVRLLRQVPAITELIQLDNSGREQLKVSRLAIDVAGSEKDHSQSPSFTEAKKQRVWFSPVYFRKESEPYMTLAMAHAGRNAGVTIAEVNLKLIWDVITGLKIGQGGYAYVVDREGRLIAHPDISLVLRNTDLATLPQVAAAHAEASSGPAAAPSAMVAKSIDGKSVLTAHASIAPLGWTVFVELPLREALAPLFGSALRTGALLVLALGLATLAALFLARRMTGPIRQLQAGAERIGAGELDRRIEIRTGDELEGLAGEFNRMAADLQKSYAELENKVEERTAELKDALDQQTATAEVLQVINSSPGDLTPVFDAILEKAHALCGAALGSLATYDGEYFHVMAAHGYPEAYRALTQRPFGPPPNSPFDLLLRGERLVHNPDARLMLPQTDSPLLRAAVDIVDIRTALFVPLRKDGLLLGYISAQRQEVRPFSDKEIKLLENFAAQAVIAMENARLITETREALEQQTATAEVLGVINSSPGNLVPVFDAMLEKAIRLCEGIQGTLWTFDGEQIRLAAAQGFSAELIEMVRDRRERQDPGKRDPVKRILCGERLIQVVDMAAEPSHGPVIAAAAEIGGVGTIVFAALVKDATPLGAFAIARREVRPFSDKQIALLQNFAAQAVIAMENARLITETREALEQQTATAEVLGVINSSPGDLAPVFDAILEKAHSLCGAAHGALGAYDSDYYFRGLAARGYPEPLAERFRQGFAGLTNPVTRPLIDGARFVHIPDLAEIDHPIPQAVVKLGGFHTGLFIPLRKDGRLLGHISAARSQVRPFSEKEIAMLENFAAQAVIAMENARLITETREALEQQTATAEVLQVINSSPGELAPVFDAILEKAHTLCGVAIGALEEWDGEHIRALATRGLSASFGELIRQGYRPGPNDPHWELVNGARFVHIPDQAEVDDPTHQKAVDLAGVRTFLAVALRKDSVLLGRIVAGRQEVRPFAEKEIALLESFAAQAVIAMENARLITETREALEQQTATAEVLGVINNSPGDVAPVFDAILEKAHTLCGAAHGSLTAYDGEYFRAVALRGIPEPLADLLRQPFLPSAGGSQERLLQGDRLVHIPDITTREANTPIQKASIEAGIRTLLIVPLRKDDALLGYITANRREVRPFTDKQIALLENFAAQAVIAMENARLITETREALEQQTATAEVLQVINASPGDLAPVFDAILEKAHSRCGAAYGSLHIADGNAFRAVAVRGMPEAFADLIRQSFQPGPNHPVRELIGGAPFAVVINSPDFDDAIIQSAQKLAGMRTALFVPLRKENALLGYIVASRPEVRPFSEKQIALLQNFAAQAVIAMENARLITETREALDQQTATAEVLGVINSSPGDLAPVFDAMLEKASRLCEAQTGHLLRFENGAFSRAASLGIPEDFDRLLPLDTPMPDAITRDSVVARLLTTRAHVHVHDLREDESYRAGAPAEVAAVEQGGIRTALFVPLLREHDVVGAFLMHRLQVRPFSDKQIALVQNFAAQAVIAIENARLITELRQRTHDLQESLEYQTATSDVLKVISQSGAVLESVLGTLVETAARICGADKAVLQQLSGGLYRMGASFGFTNEYREYRARNPIGLDRGTAVGRMAVGREVVHIEDALNDPEYDDIEAQRLGEFRTMLAVPLLREDTVIGGLFLARSRVERFTEKQIALVTTFADQAVIAIENARLFNELRARTAELGRSVDELKMLSEVGQAVSSTLDLRAVLSTILTRSVGLAGAEAGVIFRYSRAERTFRFVEAAGYTEAMLREVSALTIPENMTGMGEAIARRAPVQIPDLRERPPNPLRDLALADGYRSVLIVPLVGADRIMGATILQRRATGEFPPETVRLMQTLASQSVLAIQNARLFREIADKSEQLALASQHKSQFLANMSHELRTPLNAILGYAELLVDGIYGQLPDRPRGVLERIQNNGKHLLALINDVLDLAKIEAGQLILTLEDYSLPELVRSVVTATEPLAASKGLKFTAAVQDGMPMAHGDARRVSQVLLNLVGNAIKFTDEGEVEIRAILERGQFVLSVRDTGPGIADADQDRIFGEFQQIDNTNTRKKGGTGLGLAISKRMVELQGGTISVESALGRGSTFRVVLPVHVDEMMEAA